MFVSDTHQRQLLENESYWSPQAFQQEWDAMMADAWHCVGTASDFPREGDYRTLTLGRRPVLLRREGGRVHAYLNVCPHRFAMLRHDESGNLPKLQCQYHGWEFSACGNTQKIPDAKSFKPLAKGMLGLTTYPLETRGDLLLLNLQQDPPPLDVFLGEPGDAIDDWFGEDYRQVLSRDVRVDANWKAYLENGIESYHVDLVHAETLVRSPREEDCRHTLADRWTRFESTAEDPRRLVRLVDRWNHRLLGAEPGPYTHLHVYPHLTFIRMSVFTYLEAVLPLGPRESLIITRGYVRCPPSSGAVRRFASGIAGRMGMDLLKRIQDEDAAVLTACQRGLESCETPRGGLIATREERIHHFQNYVQQQLGEAAAVSVTGP